jgi:hypothetical protein
LVLVFDVYYISCSVFGWNTQWGLFETVHSNMEENNGLPNGSFQNWAGWLLFYFIFFSKEGKPQPLHQLMHMA